VGAGYVAILTAELHFPEAGSLKGKRHFVRSAKDNLRNRFGASVAEVDHHDLWQRTAHAVAIAAGEGYHAKRVLHEVERLVERWGEVELIDAEVSLHYPDA
jgi:uncharacterized protein YlxP (DUF503 family)